MWGSKSNDGPNINTMKTVTNDRKTDCGNPEEIPASDPQSVDELLSVIAGERRKSRNCARATQAFFVAIFGLMLIAMIGVWMRKGHFPWDIFSSFASMSGVIGSGAYISAQRKKTTLTLTQFEDKRVIGPLAEALDFGDKDIRAVALQALQRLLPQLMACDAHLLDAEQRYSLNRVLKHARSGADIELAIQILKAYEQVGDPKALEEVESLAKTRIRGKVSAELIEAAKACLPALKERIRLVSAEQTLLRAASARDLPADQLLRPVSGSYTTQSEARELLRAYSPDNGDTGHNELITAILKQVQRDGDRKAIPYVEQIAASADASDSMRDAARECLEALLSPTAYYSIDDDPVSHTLLQTSGH